MLAFVTINYQRVVVRIIPLAQSGSWFYLDPTKESLSVLL
jgi:hypothetical protein